MYILRTPENSCTPERNISSQAAPWLGLNNTAALSLQERTASVHPGCWPPHRAAPTPTPTLVLRSYWAGNFGLRWPWVQCLPPLM